MKRIQSDKKAKANRTDQRDSTKQSTGVIRPIGTHLPVKLMKIMEEQESKHNNGENLETERMDSYDCYR